MLYLPSDIYNGVTYSSIFPCQHFVYLFEKYDNLIQIKRAMNIL